MARQLTEKQRRKLQKLSKVIDGGNYAILEHLFEIEEKLEEKISELDGKIPNIKDALESIKGKDGYTPEKGKDYSDGYTPVKGVDYHDGKDYVLTDRDKSDIARSIKVPIVERVVERNRETIVKEIPIVRETIVKEPLTVKFSPQELRDLIELLRDDERLDAKSIKGIEEMLRKINPPNGPMLHPVALSNLPDVGVVGVSVGQVLTWNGTYWYPTTPSSGGSGFQQPLTGGLNQGTFTWTTAPNVIVIDGVPRQKTQTDGTSMWTGTTTTVLTVNCPKPTFDIFSPA